MYYGFYWYVDELFSQCYCPELASFHFGYSYIIHKFKKISYNVHYQMSQVSL